MSKGGKRMVRWSSDSLRHRACTPASSAHVERSTLTRPTAIPPRHHTNAQHNEPGVPPMTDNPSYRGQGQGQPGDDYYDYGRQQDPRAPYPPETRAATRLPAVARPPTRAAPGGYPEQGGYPRRAGRLPGPGWLPARRLRPASARRLRPARARRLPRPGWLPARRLRPAPAAGYGQPPAAPGGYGQPPAGEYDYGRAPAPQPDGYGRQGYPDQGGYPPEQGGYPDQGGYGAAGVRRARTTHSLPATTTANRLHSPATRTRATASRLATTTASPPRSPLPPPPATERVTAPLVPRPSRWCSTTAATARTSSAKVPTSSAAARMRSSGFPTPAYPVGTSRSAGTARWPCCRTSTRPTAPR